MLIVLWFPCHGEPQAGEDMLQSNALLGWDRCSAGLMYLQLGTSRTTSIFDRQASLFLFLVMLAFTPANTACTVWESERLLLRYSTIIYTPKMKQPYLHFVEAASAFIFAWRNFLKRDSPVGSLKPDQTYLVKPEPSEGISTKPAVRGTQMWQTRCLAKSIFTESSMDSPRCRTTQRLCGGLAPSLYSIMPFWCCRREANSGAYRLSTFFAAKTLVTFPMQVTYHHSVSDL